ncbi:vanin-like protein 1 [Plodia interpunctella]|uniref:vanin-like protein 1 n=1 Tax=Plodia interpunctella TaxID=58824 RepID=UPI002367CA3E|nr:vanin-like protein 1 [Plodia interpunctella]
MSVSVKVFCLLLTAIRISDQKSTPESDSYVAAVVEFKLTSNSTQALKEYVHYITMASEKNADVVVFPEMTLVRKAEVVRVPIHGSLRQHPIPALTPHLYDEPLVAISKAARDNGIYVVINVQEQMDCSSSLGEYCPEKKVYRFNTNVVFDRSGAVIDRYRKINLFGEATRHPALKQELGIFSTDFGVTFGHFICFDVLFQVPAVQVVQKYNLTDIIFPTMWFSEMPFLTAVQNQQAYAYSMNVNFLAANANNIHVGTAGSGIYSGRAGALVSMMTGIPSTRLLVERVPKVPGKLTRTYPGPIFNNPSDPDNLLLNKDVSLASHVSKELVSGFQEFSLTEKDVRCKFTVRINQTGQSHKYRAFIQDSSNTYVKRHVAVASCSIVACRYDDVVSCPYRFSAEDAKVEFEELQIEMTTYPHRHNSSLDCENIIYYPVSLRINKFPLDSHNFTYSESNQNGDNENGGREKISYKLNAPQNDLIAFAVWGRIYDKDISGSYHVTEEDESNFSQFENMIYKTV